MGMCLLQSYLLGHLPPPDVLGLVLSSESRSSTVLPCTACDDDAGDVKSVCVAVARDTSDDADADAGSEAEGDADPPIMKGMLARASQSCAALRPAPW